MQFFMCFGEFIILFYVGNSILDGSMTIGEMSKYLADMIEGSTGIRLEVVTDETPVSEYEILVGKTNREDQGLVNVDRAAFEDDQTYVWTVQGNYLVITGIDDDYDLNTKEDKSHRGIKGTRNAVFKFCEEVFSEGQEILILVTELTINYHTSHFISRYGCKEYFNHNKELLFYERQKEIIREIENLELED